MPDLEKNIKTVYQKVQVISNKAGRSHDAVALLAASKTRSVAIIQRAYDLGLRQFAENYAAEAVEKMPHLPKDIQWHFIGPIQSNKTRLIAEHFDWVHTVDREKIVQRLASQRPAALPRLKCLIQINISEEPQKSGIHPEQLIPLAESISCAESLSLQGLMAIPKSGQNKADLSTNFAKMQFLSQQLQEQYPEARHLSMGMSADFELAIFHNATMVRLGTELFGPR